MPFGETNNILNPIIAIRNQNHSAMDIIKDILKNFYISSGYTEKDFIRMYNSTFNLIKSNKNKDAIKTHERGRIY